MWIPKDQFNQLTVMIDGDGPAGPFWEALSEKNEELNPEEYSLHTKSIHSDKKEIA